MGYQLPIKLIIKHSFGQKVLACLMLVLSANFIYGLLYFLSPSAIHNLPLIGVLVIDSIIMIALALAYRKTEEVATATLPQGEAETRPGPMQFKTHALVLSNYTDEFLVNSIPNILCIKDGAGQWLVAKFEYLQFFNLEGGSYKGKTNDLLKLIAKVNVEALDFDNKQDMATWSSKKSRKDESIKALIADNCRYDIRRIPVFGGNGLPLRLIITGTVFEKYSSSRAMLFPAMFFSSSICCLLLDAKFKIVLVNEAVLKLTGLAESDCIDMNVFFLTDSEGNKVNFLALSSENKSKLWSGVLTCLCKDAESVPVKVFLSLLDIPGTGKNSLHYIVNLYDISEQTHYENKILKLAHYDDLTGLPNRVKFCEILADAMVLAGQEKSNLAVLFLDLDRFKNVNDSLGHHAGDELLKRVAERFLTQVKEDDVVARLSGDEFAILMRNEKSYENSIFSSTILAQQIINDIARNFYIQQQRVFVGVSIGISIFPEDADTVEELLRYADLAMFEAKRQGRNAFQFFNPSHVTQSQKRSQIEQGLRGALKRNEMQLYYQPQYLAQNRQLWGAEVLIRWIYDKTYTISPDQFIPIAEEIGLISSIGKWILETACQQQARWLSDGHMINHMSVNVSARQFLDPHFIDIVEEALAKASLDPKYLELELTESMLIGDPKKIELQLARLKRVGLTIALDDFGTGYSSLSYLKDFPIDILKIDKSFIKDMKEGSKESRITRAIIDIGHSLGQKVIAEGVEDEAQYRHLLGQGCDIIQGYYFSRPLPTLEMKKLLVESEKVDPFFPFH